VKVLFIAKGNDDPTTRYRVLPLMSRLLALGHSCELLASDIGLAGKVMLLRRAPQFDWIFIQRKLFTSMFTRMLRRRQHRLVFDFDDAIFCNSDGSVSASRARRFKTMTQLAELTFAGNQYLVEACQKDNHGKKVMLLPTAIDPDLYTAQRRTLARPLTLVWIGSRSTGRYLHLLDDVFTGLAKKLPGIKVKVVADFEYTHPSIEVVNQPWSSATEAQALQDSDIGLSPLVDDAWTRGKCALKVLQYMAAGLPVIASRVGANIDVLGDASGGYLVEQHQEWVDAIRALSDPLVRQRMGDAGLARVKAAYSVDVIMDRALTALLPSPAEGTAVPRA
jgi:glycosyltransferase involved in cell wall biosynthesis